MPRICHRTKTEGTNAKSGGGAPEKGQQRRHSGRVLIGAVLNAIKVVQRQLGLEMHDEIFHFEIFKKNS